MDKLNIHHINHHLNLRHWLHDKYNDLVVADTLRSVALSMVALFVPIYLIEQGFSLFSIAILVLIIQIGNTFLFSFITYAMKQLGIKRILILSYVIYTFLYIALYNAPELSILFFPAGYLLIIAVLSIVSESTYWAAHHSYMLSTTRAKESGKKTGTLMALPIFFSIIGPLLGALIITNFNYRLIFLINILILLIASGTLFFSDNIRVKQARFKLKAVIDKRHMTKNLIYIFQGMGFAGAGLTWPLFLFFSKIKIITIGFLFFLSNLAHGAVCYFAGKECDKRGNRKFVQIGTIGHGLTLVLRTLTVTFPLISFWQTLGSLFAALHFVPLESGYYRVSHHDQANKTVNREVYLNLGRTIFILFFLGFLYKFSDLIALQFAVILSGLAIMIISFLARKKSKIIY
jgi:MFS family permease